MDDLLSEFLTETAENISVLDVELVRLEQDPNNPGLLGNIFRLVHTIKGTCGFLGLPRLESVAHAAENVLGRFREGELHVTPAAVSLILLSLDRIKMILATLEATEAEPAGEDGPLIASLNQLAETGIAFVGDFDDEPAPTAVPVVETPSIVLAIPEPTPTLYPAGEAHAAEPAVPKDLTTGESSLANNSIRVNVDVLENLMTMVSELVLTRNQLLQILRNKEDSDFAGPLQHLNHVVSELQDGVMKTRMQPIGNAWSKLPRIIRDLAHELGKKIDLDMRGADTELDRQVLELIKDPLTHMVRNSADHGIETPADRLRAGKPEAGRVTLDAYHEGGHIIIRIADDGKGLAVEKIKQKAVANRLASQAELAGMSDQQIQQFIFKAGFSTAEKITSVSGRGVGMDVVRTNIEKIGGTIELNSVEGKGSAFTIKIPLTLAIVSALIVEAAGERFAMPQIGVVELVRATSNGENRIERLKGAPFLRLRDRLLPLVSLRDVLKLDAGQGDAIETFIIVSQVGAYTFGIMVDRVFDTEEIVVKPVSPVLRHIPMFSGNTILGDGSVIMILDPNGIAAATGSVGASDRTAVSSAAAHAVRQADPTSLMLFRAGIGAPKAVPLSLVARLEDIDRCSIEQSDGKPVVQYRGRLMPLVPFDPSFVLPTIGKQPVLVFADETDRTMGLMVDEIVDIVEDQVRIQLSGERPGLIGSAIIVGKATDIIDVGHYLHLGLSDFFGSTESFEDETGDAKRVLLVDDSPFFRNLLTPLLSVAGYQVRTAASASEALKAREAGEVYDVIVSDIEMPGMSGFAFAEQVRSDERWRDIPVVALSSHATARDLDRGRQAGFTGHIAKLDRDVLLRTLSETLSQTRGAA